MRSAILLFLSLVVFSSERRLHADDRTVRGIVPKGIRALTFKLPKDEKHAEDIRPGVIVGCNQFLLG